MAKFKFELSPEQLAEVTKQAKEKLEKEFQVILEKTKKQHQLELEKLDTKFKNDVESLNAKFKYGEVTVEDSKPTPTGARHTWTDAEIETLVKLWKEGKRAKAIALELGINAGGVNAKATALSKLGKLK